jgi:hypothetical protein
MSRNPLSLAAIAAVFAFSPLTAAIAKETASGWDKFKAGFESGKSDAEDVAEEADDKADEFKVNLANIFKEDGKDDDAEDLDLGFKSPFKK